ncbi:effector binding domain-containing protein [Vagococcus humatus]|uniref:Integron-associated effector binding protein domain-containing protein n=1 Tax=Vagococcus humatus TaxID=1889241 RepID=A0A429Z956_9ENTE|nr:effector binding domain-containing protein [Vagococcus humatus]RST90185.1 hypothetical protein C7P63_03665 [Vagococcus humatus]
MLVYEIDAIQTHSITTNLKKSMQELWEVATISLSNYKGARYVVYHHYHDPGIGDFTLSLATESLVTDTPLAMPKQTFRKFSTKTSITNLWSQIHQLEQSGELRRAFTYDFEKYLPNGQIELYVSVC